MIEARSWSDERKGPQAKGYGWPLEAETVRKQILLESLLKDTALLTLGFNQ